MLRLKKQQHKSEKSGQQRFDFQFSSLQALQVPKGWDKLFVSVISLETRKTLVKSGKALVSNGSCQWTESLSKSIWISQRDPSKENDECRVKFVVSMGSSRSGALGEATVNLASHKNSRTAVQVSLPLKKCTHGTILKVKIWCLAPRAEIRKECEDTGLYREDSTVDYEYAENKSDVSDSSFGRSIGSSSGNHLDSTSHTHELNRDTSFSASGRRYSFDSMDGSLGRGIYSSHNNLSGIMHNHMRRQDSTGSQSSSSCGSYSFNNSARSSHTSFNSKVSTSQSHLSNLRDEFSCMSHSAASSPLRNSGLSHDLLEAAEVTIEELRVQATMWEQNACKLMDDVERLKKEVPDQSKHHAKLEMELSESHRERDYLKQEVKRLNVQLEESRVKQEVAKNLKLKEEEMDGCQKELEGELKFQVESNANLALQLKKAQDSNLELVSILQELEDTIGRQKIEITNMSGMPSENKDARKYSHGFEVNEEMKQRKQVIAESKNDTACASGLGCITVKHKSEDLPAVSEADERQWQESPDKSENIIKFLEKSLEEKVHELQIERSLRAQNLAELEAEWRDRSAEIEEDISNLKIGLSEALSALGSEKNGNLVKEIGVLKQKIEELERECHELTDVNIELLLKLKESKLVVPAHYASSNSSSSECIQNGFMWSSESEVCRRKSHRCKVALEENILQLEGDLTAREALIAVDDGLKNETLAKMANSEFRREIRHLEEENREYQRRSQAFEEDLKQHHEEKHQEHESSFSSFSICPETNTKSISTSDESNLTQVLAKPICSAGNSLAREVGPFLKIQLLETELAEALETNDLYKAQLKRNLMDEDKLHDGDGDQHQASLIERLKDLGERFFHMSLKYAGVEADHEQLVLKLKSVSNGRRWFA